MIEEKKRSIWELAPGADDLKLTSSLKREGLRVNILALGDVGATLLMGLKTMGGGLIERIGIYDVNPQVMSRYEIEMNQIGWPFGERMLPEVGFFSPEIVRRVVVFPAPFAPIRVTISPSLTVREMPFKAWITPKWTFKSFISSMVIWV